MLRRWGEDGEIRADGLAGWMRSGEAQAFVFCMMALLGAPGHRHRSRRRVLCDASPSRLFILGAHDLFDGVDVVEFFCFCMAFVL